MASKSNTTTDHDEIRRWVEEHDGKPATVRGTENGDEAGVLRIDFPGGAGDDRLETTDWVNVDNLRELGSADTSSVTVLLSTDPAEANPGPRWEQRWKTARRELEGRGADAGSLEQLDGAAIDA